MKLKKIFNRFLNAVIYAIESFIPGPGDGEIMVTPVVIFFNEAGHEFNFYYAHIRKQPTDSK